MKTRHRPNLRKAPLILVSPSTDRRGREFYSYSLTLSGAYTQAVAAGGGIPWVLSCTPDRDLIAESVRRSDGVLLSGGHDLHPDLYSPSLPQAVRATIKPADPLRDLVELWVVEEVFRQRKPLLAICRGQQLLNIAFGGTLTADIALQCRGSTRHDRSDRKDHLIHTIRIQPDTILAQVFGREELGVNSSHHQAVAAIPKLFQVTALSPDGIVEALELGLAHRGLIPYLLAVQFHPERLIEKHPEFVRLFRSFALACVQSRNESL